MQADWLKRVKFTFGKRKKSQNGARATHKAASSHRRIMKFVFEPHSIFARSASNVENVPSLKGNHGDRRARSSRLKTPPQAD